MTIAFASVDEIRARIGAELGPSGWLEIDQDRVNAFADVTDDHQWIHVDPERASASTFGGTIAHGHLTASLIPALVRGIYRMEGARMGVNYGSDKIRFPSPVLVGSRVRATAVIEAVEEGPRGAQIIVRVTVHSDRSERPVCVATTRSLVVF